MQYLKVVVKNAVPGRPVVVYSEIDEARTEVRRVETYADGRCDYADALAATGTTALADNPLPTVEQITIDPRFDVLVLSGVEFAKVWATATTS